MRNLLWPVALCLLCGCADKRAIDNAEWAVQKRLPQGSGSLKFSAVFVVRGATTLATCGYVDIQARQSRFMADQSENNVRKTTWPRIVAIESPNMKKATVRSASSANKATVFEEAYWNQSCVDATHPRSYTGE